MHLQGIMPPSHVVNDLGQVSLVYCLFALLADVEVIGLRLRWRSADLLAGEGFRSLCHGFSHLLHAGERDSTSVFGL